MKTYIVIFMLVVVAPSGFLFYKMTKRNFFEANSTNFVEKIVEPSTRGIVNYEFSYRPDSSTINISIQGDIIDDETKTFWQNQLMNYD